MTTLVAQSHFPVNTFSIVKKMNAWTRKSQTREQLKHLSEQQLKDIGLSKSQAIKESQRPFWN